MRVTSLFDGISCAQHALKKITNEPYVWFSSEIDQKAIEVTQKHFPKTFNYGCVKENFIDGSNTPYGIDLLIAGSPCQGFSFAGNQLNFNDERSKLFFEFVRALEIIRPKYFLLENVKMKKAYSDIITETLKKIYPDTRMHLFDSAKVSCQSRNRLYWTNFKWDHEIDESAKHTLKSVLGSSNSFYNYSSSGRGNGRVEGRFTKTEKALTLTASGYSQRAKTFTLGMDSIEELIPNINNVWSKRENTIDYICSVGSYRDLFPFEMGKIQGLGENIFGNIEITPSKAISLIGNGMEVNTIEHILRTGIF